MNKFTFVLAVCAVQFFANIVCRGGDDQEPKQILRLALDLTDGSHIIGTPSLSFIPVQTSYAKMSIPVTEILNMTMDDNHETASFELANGDRLTGTFDLGPLELDTVFGKVSVGIEHIRSLHVRRGDGVSLLKKLKDNLVLNYSFDRDDGDRVTDLSGKGNHGIVHGARWAARGKVGGAFSFDGKGSFIAARDSDSLRLTTGLTAMAWIKADAPAGGDGWDGIVVKGDEAERNYAIGRSGGPKAISWYMTNGQGRWSLTSKSSVSDGKWHLIATTWDGSRVLLYVDGIDDVDNRDPINYGSRWSAPLTANDKPLVIGGVGPRYPFSFFSGLIDEVMIFNRALTEQDIGVLYDSQK